MKIKNKRTGKIVEWENNLSYKLGREYHSIEEFVKDWEDVPEPKKHYWVIDDDGLLVCRRVGDFACEGMCKQIGNYFETEEEAEKAVEKLKAWKRLKDNDFKIKGWKFTPDMEQIQGNYVKIEAEIPQILINEKDIDLLFSGGEE